MDFEKLCAERYSLRKYADRPVEAEKLEKVLEAGHNAPTAHNLQPQRILVMQSREALEKAEECTACKFHAPVILVVAYDPAKAWNREGDMKNHGEIDATIAATQMMLQAADLGLGTCYVGMFSQEKLHELFPEMKGLVATAMLPLGYPAETATSGIWICFLISRIAAAASMVGTATRIMSHPASSRRWICSIVAATFSVFVLHMDWIRTGFPPPIFLSPI